MGMLDYLNDYVTGYALSQNPAMQKQYFQQEENNKRRQQQTQLINEKRAYEQEQAQLWGQQANAVYGNQAIPQQAQMQQQQMEGPMMPGQARPMQNVNQITQPGQQATGVFQGASPEQARQYGLQKRAMQTGQIPGMQMQLGAVNPMQTSSMANEQSGINNQSNNANALQRQAMQNQQSGINNRANNQQRMQQSQMNSNMYQSANNPEAYKAFMDQQNQAKPEDIVKGENDLQKVYFKESDDFNAIDDAYARVKVAQDTGIGDTSLIFSIMKLMDPRSTVREGEAATAKNSAGLPAWVSNLYNEVVEGRTLSPEARNNILAQADSFYGASKEKFQQNLGKLEGVADRRGYNKENVFTRSFMKDNKAKAKPVAKPGTKIIENIPMSIDEWRKTRSK